MKIAELKGDKTVTALAKRLLKESPSDTSATELAATLVRLNPHLSDIGHLEKGTPILLPPDFAAAEDAIDPLTSLAATLAQEAGKALQDIRTALRASASQVGNEIDQAQVWLKSEEAKLILRDVPELKEEFSKTASAASDLRKTEIALYAGQEKALKQLQAELEQLQGSPPPTGRKR
jgi:hypothetical protein